MLCSQGGHIKLAGHIRVPRLMVLTLALLLLFSSVIVHLNDMTTHSMLLKVYSAQEAHAVEHLEAHDHLNILFPSEENPHFLNKAQLLLLPLCTFPFLTIFVFIIDHPPK